MHIGEWASRVINTKRTGSGGCVGKKVLFFTNFQSGTPARRQVTFENCVYRGQGGGMTHIERDWTQGSLRPGKQRRRVLTSARQYTRSIKPCDHIGNSRARNHKPSVAAPSPFMCFHD